MWEFLIKLRFPVMLVLVGILLIAPSMLTGLGVTSFNPAPRESISWPLFVVGIVFVAAGILVFLLEADKIPMLNSRHVRKSEGATRSVWAGSS